jgi:hypothetical protein
MAIQKKKKELKSEAKNRTLIKMKWYMQRGFFFDLCQSKMTLTRKIMMLSVVCLVSAKDVVDELSDKR